MYIKNSLDTKDELIAQSGTAPTTGVAPATVAPVTAPTSVLDYENWGAADWRKFLPTPVTQQGYWSGESWIPETKSYAPFSANGYDFTVGPDGYITSVSKDGQRLNTGQAEQTRYVGAGLLDPRFQGALSGFESTPGKIDDFLATVAGGNQTNFIAAAGLLGQINDRGTVGWGSADSSAFAPTQYWGNAIQSGATGGYDYFDPTLRAKIAGLGATGSDTQAAADWWNGNMSASAQTAADDKPDDGFGSLLPIIAIAAMAYFTAGASLAGTGTITAAELGAAASADLAAGYGIGAASAGAAGTTGLAAAGSGLMSSIGTNALIGAGKSLLTGGDPLQGALMGGVTGALGANGLNFGGGIVNSLGMDPGNLATAVGTGINAAAVGGGVTAIRGGTFSDVLENAAISGVSSGVGSYVGGAVRANMNGVAAEQAPAPVSDASTYNGNASSGWTNALSGAAGGAASGGTQALLSGGDIGRGIMSGGISGAAGGLASDFGAGPGVSGAVRSVTGGLVNSALQDDAVVVGGPGNSSTGQNNPTRSNDFSWSFSNFVPDYRNLTTTRTRPNWGGRLNLGRG